MLLDVILSLATQTNVPVRRATGGQFVNGIWQPGQYVTLILDFAVITPATGMARVVGGRDMRADEQGQRVDDVRALYTNVELRTREGGSRDPDQILFRDSIWYVVRTEEWAINDEVCWRSLITREVRGSS